MLKSDIRSAVVEAKLKELERSVEKITLELGKPFYKRSKFLGAGSAVLACFVIWILIPFFTGDPGFWRWTHSKIFRTQAAIQSTIDQEELMRMSSSPRLEGDAAPLHSALERMMISRVETNQKYTIYGSHQFTSMYVRQYPISCYIVADAKLVQTIGVERDKLLSACVEGATTREEDRVEPDLIEFIKTKVVFHSGLELPFRVRPTDKVQMFVYARSNASDKAAHKYLTYRVNNGKELPVKIPLNAYNYSFHELEISSIDPEVKAPIPQSVSISLTDDGHAFIENDSVDFIPTIKVDVTLVISRG